MHLAIQGFSAWVEINGKETDQYQPFVSDDQTLGTSWIPSIEGKEFRVYWEHSNHYGGIVHTAVYVDGVKCNGVSTTAFETSQGCISFVDRWVSVARGQPAETLRFRPLAYDDYNDLDRDRTYRRRGTIQLVLTPMTSNMPMLTFVFRYFPFDYLVERGVIDRAAAERRKRAAPDEDDLRPYKIQKQRVQRFGTLPNMAPISPERAIVVPRWATPRNPVAPTPHRQYTSPHMDKPVPRHSLSSSSKPSSKCSSQDASRSERRGPSSHGTTKSPSSNKKVDLPRSKPLREALAQQCSPPSSSSSVAATSSTANTDHQAPQIKTHTPASVHGERLLAHLDSRASTLSSGLGQHHQPTYSDRRPTMKPHDSQELQKPLFKLKIEQDLKPVILEASTVAMPTTTTTPAPRPNPPASVPARTSHSLDPNLSPRTRSEQKMVAMAERALQSAGSTPDARSAANTALMRFFTASMDKTYSSWRLPVAERVLASPYADNDCRVAANALVAKGLFRLARGIKRGLSDAREVAHKAEAVRDSSRSDGIARRAANEALERVFDWVCTGDVLQHAWSTEYAERARDSPNTNVECRSAANALLTKILKDSTFS